MPLYENWTNVVNHVEVSKASAESMVLGSAAVMEHIAREIQRRHAKTVVLDGWYGVDFPKIQEMLEGELAHRGIDADFVHSSGFFADADAIAAYKQTYITDDPGFGWVNSEGTLEDILDSQKIDGLQPRGGCTVVIGCGAYSGKIREIADFFAYFDMTMQPMLWQMWDGALVPFGARQPAKAYGWKEYYYCDYYLLSRQKKACVANMDAYVEAVHSQNMKLISRDAYLEVLSAASNIPLKQVPILQPGPWGAYRFLDRGWDVQGLACNAWNLNVGPELSIVLDFGAQDTINIPFLALMDAHQEEIVGKVLASRYPTLFPFHIWLDDGYFPEPQPAERTSMPIHNHPDTAYVQRHFNEPLGRYETYYIAEAFEGANTWMGFREDADMEAFERKCRESNNLQVIEDWKDYIANWKSNPGDLYLIPPGTIHGHGGNQIVIEMDTCPSVCGTEYSFFQYDFARNTWDDHTKTMTGKPMKMHLEHAFDNERWRREQFVREKHLARPEVIRWTKEYFLDQYSTQPEMPYDVQRLHYYERAQHDTQGLYTHVATLQVGTKTTIRSLAHPERACTILAFQSVVIPADFGAYEVVNDGRNYSILVLMKWKAFE